MKSPSPSRFFVAGLLLVFSTSITKTFAQAPDSIWTRVIDLGGSEECVAAAEIIYDEAGGFLLAGTRSVTDDSSLFLVRTDSEGQVTWSHVYGLPGAQVCHGMESAWFDSVTYIWGETTTPDSGLNAIILKVDTLGDLIWASSFGGLEDDRCVDVIEGRWTICTTSSFGVSGVNSWFLRLNGDGTIGWEEVIESDSVERASVLGLTGLDRWWVAGTAGTLDQSFFFRLFDPAEPDLIRYYGGSGQDVLTGFEYAWGERYLLTGYSTSFSSSGDDFLAIWVNGLGDSLWSFTWGGDARDVCTCVHWFESNSHHLLAGHSRSFGDGSYDFAVVELDTEGNLLWERVLRGNESEECHAIVEVADGSILLAGHTRTSDDSPADIMIAKLDYVPNIGLDPGQLNFGSVPVGQSVSRDLDIINSGSAELTVEQVVAPEGYSSDFSGPASVAVGERLTIQVTFEPPEVGVYIDTLTIISDAFDGDALLRLIGAATQGSAADEREPLPTEYSLGPAIPNPFNAATTIEFALPVSGHTRLTVHDITGRLVRTLTDAHYSAGYHTITFDAADLPSGIYIYTIHTTTFTNSKKMVLVK